MPTAIEVEVPDGIVEFPEDTKPEEITNALNAKYAKGPTPPAFEAPPLPDVTPEQRKQAQEPWYKPPPEWSEPLGGRTEIPSGANTSIPALTIPASAVGQTAAGVVDYFTSPQGATEALLAATPAAPAIYVKWAKDMLHGAKASFEDTVEAVKGLLGHAVTRGYMQGMGIAPSDADKKETQERLQDIANGVVNTAAMSLGTFGAIKGAAKPLLPRATEAARATIKSEGGDASRLREDAGQVQTGGIEQPGGEGEGGANLEQPTSQQPGGAAPQGQVGGQTALSLGAKPRVRITQDPSGGYNISIESKEGTRTAIAPTLVDAQALAEKMTRRGAAPVTLSPEEQAYLDAERGSIDKPVEVVEQPLEDDTVPFAGQVATIDRATGKVLVNGPEFSAWLSKVPEERKALAVRSLLSEERIHLAVDDVSAADYWHTLTEAERAITRRRYTGSFSGKESLTGEKLNLTDLDFGHEAIRTRLQQLARMEPREIAEAAGKERWKLQMITALESAIRGIRETLGTKASKEGLQILGRMQDNLDAAKAAVSGAAPAAINKQREFELPPVKGKGVLSQPEREPAVAMLAKAEAARYEPVTAKGLEAETARHLAESDKPSFEDYAKEVRNKFGDVQPGQLREVWRDSVWKTLMEAPGKKLRELVKSSGLSKQLKLESQAGDVRNIVDAPTEGPDFKLQSETEGIKGLPREASTPALRERYRVIAALGDRLITEAEEGRKELRREITPEDIRYGQEASWNALTGREDPVSLGRILTDNARVFGEKVSETKRLTVMQNRKTGKVEMVSTFLDPRRGPVLLDPDAPSKTHGRLDSVLQRYRPIYSVLLDEPVQNYRQRFDSLRAFEDDFGTEARQRSEGSTYSPEYLASEGELTPSPSGGRMPKPGIYQDVPSAMAADVPMTDAEAGAVLDHLYDEVSKVETPEDMRSAFDALVSDVEQEKAPSRYGQFQVSGESESGVKQFQIEPSRRARNQLVMTAIAKAYRQTREASPDLTHEQTISKVLDTFYENASKAENREAFVKKSLGQFGAKAVEVDRPAARRPGAIQKARERIEGEAAVGARTAAALWNRRKTKQEIAAGFDAAWNSPNQMGEQARMSILLDSKNPKVLEASKPLIQSGIDKTKLPDYYAELDKGDATAKMLIQHGSMIEKFRGQKALNYGKRLRAELDYAKAHWNDPDLQAVAKSSRRELDDAFAYGKSSGLNINYYENHLPGRYEREFMAGNTVMFGENSVLGTKYKGPKTFPSYYHAYGEGLFIAKNLNPADLVSHAVRRIYRDVSKPQWKGSLKSYTDPDSGQKVAVEPEYDSQKRAYSPDPNRELVYFNDGQPPLAIWKGYDKLARALTNVSAIADTPIGRPALALTAALKHSILLGDFFHLGRLSYYGSAIMGRKFGYKGGWAALAYREADLPRAVAAGEITQKQADWSTTKGKSGWTPRQVIQEATNLGANLGRIQDALYMDVTRNFPVIGKYNKFLFDKFTRGLMAQSIVHDFERQFAKSKRPPQEILRDVAKDANTFFGSLGHQGVLKSATMRDISQLMLLAPQWVEGLVGKEVGTIRELGQFAKAGGKEPLGMIGAGVGRGLVTMFALTQVINLITRRQATFQNDEEGHKLDAWIPDVTGKGPGFWVSPLSVFAEITHDLVRLFQTKPKAWDAARQIGENKLGPWSRVGLILATDRTPRGEYITSTPGIVKEAAKSAAPVPISFGRLAQSFGSLAAPKLVSPPPTGATQRQVTSMLGIKTEPAEDALRQVQAKARRFVKEQGLDNQMIHIEATTEPSYAKLRSAISQGDERGMRNIFEELKKSRSDEQIMKAMKQWARYPFTGSNKTEKDFLNSLNDKELAIYTQAMQQKQEVFNDFLDAYMKMP